MNFKNEHPNLSNLIPIFKKYKTILAVYLFGSTANRKRHKESDIDIAIVPGERGVQKTKLDILSDLARAGFCNVDLVFLDTDDIVLKFEAVRPDRIIYQKEGFDSGALYSKIVRQYFDFYPHLIVQRQAYKKRILNGQS